MGHDGNVLFCYWLYLFRFVFCPGVTAVRKVRQEIPQQGDSSISDIVWSIVGIDNYCGPLWVWSYRLSRDTDMEVTPCTGSLTMSGRSSFGSSDRIALTCNYPYTGRAMDLFPGTSYPMIYSPEHHTPVDLFPGTNDIQSGNSRHVECIALMTREKG